MNGFGSTGLAFSTTFGSLNCFSAVPSQLVDLLPIQQSDLTFAIGNNVTLLTAVLADFGPT